MHEHSADKKSKHPSVATYLCIYGCRQDGDDPTAHLQDFGSLLLLGYEEGQRSQLVIRDRGPPAGRIGDRSGLEVMCTVNMDIVPG